MSSKRVKVEFEIDGAKMRRGRKTRRSARERRSRRLELLEFARQLARVHALTHPEGLCTVDDVYEALTRLGHAAGVLGNTAGSIFRGGGWESTRLRLRSRRPSSRGREIKVWHLASMPGGCLDSGGVPSPYAVVVDDYRPARPVVAGPVAVAKKARARRKSRSC